MTSSSPGSRDGLAFVLTSLGASSWAMFPAIALVRGEGLPGWLTLPIAFTAGGFLGAWCATRMWRNVSWPAPVITAALVALALMTLRRHARFGDVAPGLLELGCVTAAAIGSAAGTQIGWRMRGVHRELVAAWIGISGAGVAFLTLRLIAVLGYVAVEGAWYWSIVLAFGPSSALAFLLCRGVRPNVFTAWIFGLVLSAHLLPLAAPEFLASAPLRTHLLQAVFTSVLVAIVAWFPVRVLARRTPPAGDLPAAELVKR